MAGSLSSTTRNLEKLVLVTKVGCLHVDISIISLPKVFWDKAGFEIGSGVIPHLFERQTTAKTTAIDYIIHSR